MENKESMNWVSFYSEFATKLLSYKDNRKPLIEKVLTIFDNIGAKVPKLESDNNLRDIDPFTIFGLFNKGITNANRIVIIKEVAKLFDVEAAIPENFDGIPVVNNQSATFYYFVGDRGEKDIDNLWNIFAAALGYSDNRTEENKVEMARCFDVVTQQKGVKWNITMGLYWVRPYCYINLDARNREFLCDDVNMPTDFVSAMDGLKQLPSGEQYMTICELSLAAIQNGAYEYKSFPELSHKAWLTTDSKSSVKKTSSAALLKWFKPVVEALKKLGGSGEPKEVREKIIEDLKLPDNVVNETRGKTGVNKFDNEVAFARNYLVYEGIIEKGTRGVWTLSEKGMTVEMTEDYASEIFTKWAAINKTKRDNANNVLADEEVSSLHYWIYAPGDNACKWDEFYEAGIMAIGWGEIGDLSEFTSKDEMKQKMKECYGQEYSYKNDAHATWQFIHEMKKGDIVFVKKGMYQIIGRGIVTSDYEYDAEMADAYNNVRSVEWTHKGEWEHPGQAVMKTLTDITSYTEYVEKLNSLFSEELSVDTKEKEIIYPEYTERDFLREVYLDEEKYLTLVNLLRIKKNIILQGAPGVGKTYAAKRLAYSIMGTKDKERVMMVQFHQSYSYEDFIMGFRPTASGFELKKGAFYEFCKKAEEDNENDYFFIIDEINRGNLSKIFGELFMLIESDKRGIELGLVYSDEKFSVPNNVHIIGMMNTADRSLAMLDYALRRRFAFFEFEPAFDSEGFQKYRMELNNTKFDRLITCVESLNSGISNDESLGDGFRIGHSYFCTKAQINDAWLSSLVEYELIPLLKEYWFDEPTKVKDWSNNLRSAIK